MAYNGNGAWPWNVAFSLPVHIRKYCLKLLSDVKAREQKQMDDSKKKSSSGSYRPPSTPHISPGKLPNTNSFNNRLPKF